MRNRKLIALVLALLVAFAMMPTMAFADEVPTTDTTGTTGETVISPNPTTEGTTAADKTEPAAAAKSNDIVILATSDVHCGIDQNIGYAGLAAYKAAMQEKYNNVVLVDAGDAIQGDTIGTLSKGEY